jgi:hypothetical protein
MKITSSPELTICTCKASRCCPNYLLPPKSERPSGGLHPSHAGPSSRGGVCHNRSAAGTPLWDAKDDGVRVQDWLLRGDAVAPARHRWNRYEIPLWSEYHIAFQEDRIPCQLAGVTQLAPQHLSALFRLPTAETIVEVAIAAGQRPRSQETIVEVAIAAGQRPRSQWIFFAPTADLGHRTDTMEHAVVIISIPIETKWPRRDHRYQHGHCLFAMSWRLMPMIIRQRTEF